MMKTTGIVLLFLAAPFTAFSQRAVSESEVVELTAEITAIDHDARMLTLQDDEGDVESLYAGPEIKRFNELTVGDKVTFRYYESLVSQIRKAGDAAPARGTGAPTLVRGTGAKPSGTLSQQLTATVTIKAIDPAVPSVTVTLEDGRTMSFKVEDKKNLEGVKVGDKVDVTYTAAVMITVK
jgi:Cu/Ag efflux protein CusF